ncbi:MAG: hemin uptake protein HemP [Pseudomonadota bacterium]|uniref:hemin uptake protein HemP n=1 Tax=Thermithiobacillus tepidarius TaxID=929 RepID=UPI0009DBE061|nr:hemin uptake protein HemP [Thermithiobacillus tepidarius]
MSNKNAPDAKRRTGKASEGEQAQQGPPCLSTSELFHAARELVIEHQGELYRLRITRNGKLILTK